MLASSPSKAFSILDLVIAALRDWTRTRRLNLRLDECDNYEVARMAHEVGLTPTELSRMSKFGSDAAKLLLDRMNAMHLNPESLAKSDPSTMRDLQRLCSGCVSKKRCKRDLIGDRYNPAWRQYCPNAGTLDALQVGAINARCSNNH